MRPLQLLLAALLLAAAHRPAPAAAAPTHGDLRRAQATTPRPSLQGRTAGEAAERMNAALVRLFAQHAHASLPCSAMGAARLRAVVAALHGAADADAARGLFEEAYGARADPRLRRRGGAWA